MELHVSLAGPGEKSTRIYRQLLQAIGDGRLRPGDRLPPTRELARRLAVARNTVAVAYERLTAEGLLAARVGSGTFVAGTGGGVARAAPAGRGVRPRAIWQSLIRPETPAPAPRYDFRLGTPDRDLFPLATWRRLVTAELRGTTLGDAYADPAGHPRLREAIARYAGVARSVRAAPDDVLVTQGAQRALDLICRVLVAPGETVAMEDPGYHPARDLFRSLGARVVPVPVDAGGLDVAALPARARLVYVTPSHQFPLGTPMSLARRQALLAWADRHGAVIVEDDYDSEFRFSDRPLAPLQSLDPTGRVIYVGTFSKTLLPALRLGFLVAPGSLRPALRTAQRLTAWHPEYATQAALARFIDSGELPRHVRKASKVYAARHAAVLAGLHQWLGAWLEPVPSAAGLHLCTRARAGVGVARAVAAARERGVAVESLAEYGAGPHPAEGVVLGYGAIRTEDIPGGLRLLADCFAAGA